LGDERLRVLLAPVLNGNDDGRGHDSAEVTVTAPHDPPARGDGPRGREGVRLIVGERPGVWTLADLRAEMKRRGWYTSDKAVAVAVTRMCAKGEARHAGTGRYEFPAPDERDSLVKGRGQSRAEAALA
jgi:hypothetical protein